MTPAEHRARIIEYRKQALALIRNAWSLVDYNELDATIARFAALAAGATTLAQRDAAYLTLVYAAGVLNVPPLPVDPQAVVGAHEAELPLTTLFATSSAFVKLATSQGRSQQDAMSSGLFRAERLASTETMRASADAMTVTVTYYDPIPAEARDALSRLDGKDVRIFYDKRRGSRLVDLVNGKAWNLDTLGDTPLRRVTGSNPCPICAPRAGQIVSNEQVTLHPSCSCTASPS